MSEIEGRPGLDDLVLREGNPNSVYGQFWVSSAEPRAMFTDEDGRDYDILEMRDALIAIRANTSSKAASLSPLEAIDEIHAICKQALPGGDDHG